MNTRQELDKLHADTGWGFSVKCETGDHCAWSAEIRVTPEPFREDGPDRSFTVFAAGGLTSSAAVNEAYKDLREWLAALQPVLDMPVARCRYCNEQEN